MKTAKNLWAAAPLCPSFMPPDSRLCPSFAKMLDAPLPYFLNQFEQKVPYVPLVATSGSERLMLDRFRLNSCAGRTCSAVARVKTKKHFLVSDFPYVTSLSCNVIFFDPGSATGKKSIIITLAINACLMPIAYHLGIIKHDK